MDVYCSYCERLTEFVDSACVYGGVSYGMIYLCRPCDAWVSVHKGTETPKGCLANAELRKWKREAHATFDPLWQAKLRLRRQQRGPDYKKAWARGSGYQWLSQKLGIEPAKCHIGMFDVETCKRVVELCAPYVGRLAS